MGKTWFWIHESEPRGGAGLRAASAVLWVAAGGMGRARPLGIAVRGAAPDAVSDGAHSRGARMGGVVGDEKG